MSKQEKKHSSRSIPILKRKLQEAFSEAYRQCSRRKNYGAGAMQWMNKPVHSQFVSMFSIRDHNKYKVEDVKLKNGDILFRHIAYITYHKKLFQFTCDTMLIINPDKLSISELGQRLNMVEKIIMKSLVVNYVNPEEEPNTKDLCDDDLSAALEKETIFQQHLKNHIANMIMREHTLVTHLTDYRLQKLKNFEEALKDQTLITSKPLHTLPRKTMQSKIASLMSSTLSERVSFISCLYLE